MGPSEIAHSTTASTPNAACSLFDELSKNDGKWIIKIGDPVEVRYADSVLHLWAIMELLTLHRPAGCSYVEIMGRGGYYSRFFRDDGMIVLGAKSSVVVALYEEVSGRSMELTALGTKDTLASKKAEILSLELF